MEPSNPLNDLSKLTVAQLKALCKERKLPGYSKLSKPSLIEKLAGANAGKSNSLVASIASENLGKPSKTTHTQDTARLSSAIRVPQVSASVSPPGSIKNTCSARSAVTEGFSDNRLDCVPASTIPSSKQAIPATFLGASPVDGIAGPSTLAGSARLGTATTVIAPWKPSILVATTTKSQIDSSITVPVKRTAKAIDELRPKKTKIAPARLTAHKPFSLSSSISAQQARSASIATTPHSVLADAGTPAPTLARLAQVECAPTLAPQPAVSKTAKRFRPLVAGSRKPQNTTDTSGIPPTSTSVRASLAGDPSLVHLDFLPVPAAPMLHSITLPPPLSQRKRVQSWAIILSGLDNASRRQCALVSRTFRYAGLQFSICLPVHLCMLIPLDHTVYLSAIHILDRKFRGKRTTRDTKPFSHAMTNFWPYLRAREEEASNRERIYSRSFLGRLEATGRAIPISPRLWGSPDHEKQATVAVRFVLASFWFALSIGGRRSEDWLRGLVVDAQEVVPHEVWSITVEHPDGPGNASCASRFYVLESTCEVIGTGTGSSNGDASICSLGPCLSLRVDWSAFINHWARSASRTPEGLLLQHLKWANHEEYDRGISRLWSKRAMQEGEVGRAKRIVAERYVLACVVANSVSGSWMSATEMAQDFAGLPNRHENPLVKLSSRDLPVNLFLPATHHVESVHFTTSSKMALHSALAAVQTSAREYFVLRDIGFEVGCEEEGIASLWMEVLDCDGKGVPV